jgi:hypothetical protein
MAKPTATLKLSPRVKNVIAFGQSVSTAMKGNAYFPSPTPPLATLDADIAGLVVSEAAVLSRTKGAAVTRDEKLAVVKEDLTHMKSYVQQVADASPATAQSIIESSGMSLQKARVSMKSDFAVRQGATPGSAHLVAKSAGRRAAYEWQYSTDQKTWTDAPTTLKAKTDILGLAAGSTYYFRFRAVLNTGDGAWSPVLSLPVV